MSSPKKFTFSNLDAFCNSQIRNMQEYKDVFSNQSQEISRFYVAIQENLSKLKLIHSEINVFKCLQEQLSGSLCEVECHLKQWEEDVSKFEQLFNCSNIDFSENNDCRSYLFNNIERVFIQLNNTNEQMENLSIIVKDCKHETHKDPVESIKILLFTHLSRLEKIEMNIFQMQNQLEDIQNLLARVMQKYNIVKVDKQNCVLPICDR